MVNVNRSDMAQRIAEAVRAFEMEAERRLLDAVTVMICDTTLVITLEGALTEIERDLLNTEGGASQVESFHHALFSRPPLQLWREIESITGSQVLKKHESGADEPEADFGVKAFANGTVVHVYQLGRRVSTSAWSESGPDLEGRLQPSRGRRD